MTNKDDLLRHCWLIFDYWISKEYEGMADEQFAKMINGMFNIIQEIGKPESKPDLGVRVTDGIGADDVVR